MNTSPTTTPHAHLSLVINDYGDQLGFSTTASLPDIIVNIIRYALSFLALAAVIMIIFGGFLWLVSGGDEERINSAKRTISGAIVGLIIVLLAWAFVSFIVGGVTGQTG